MSRADEHGVTRTPADPTLSTGPRTHRQRRVELPAVVALVIGVGGVIFAVYFLWTDEGFISRVTPASTETPITARECETQIGSFVGTLDQVRSATDGQPAFGQMSTALAAARNAHDDIDLGVATVACGAVRARAEKVYHAYLGSLRRWAVCAETSCPRPTRKMHRQWHRAGSILTGVEESLR